MQIENYYEPWQRWFELRVYPNAHGISIFFTDITERKTAETAIRASSQALRRANSDLEQFAFSASHDLQEPLRMVAIYSQLLQKKYSGRLDDQADMIIRQCVNGAVRMEQLIKDLLEYTRASAPATSVPELTDIGPVLRQTLENLEAAIQETPGGDYARRLTGREGRNRSSPADISEPGQQRSKVPLRDAARNSHRR